MNTDAHAAVHLGHLRYGVGTAQRGWLTGDDVINTWPLERLRGFLRKKIQREDFRVDSGRIFQFVRVGGNLKEACGASEGVRPPDR